MFSFWANVFSFRPDVFTFRPDVFTFRPKVFTSEGQVFSFGRGASPLRPSSAGSGQVLRQAQDEAFRAAGMTGMCPLWQANVSSFWPEVSTFRPNASSFGGNVSSFRPNVSSPGRRALHGP